MRFRQLILRNLIGNARIYASYFFSSLFATFVFYIFSMLLFHPQMQEELSNSEMISELAKVGLWVALVVIALLSLLFLWYTCAVFLKQRKRDLAIYLTLGIEEKDLRRLLFFENFLLGIGATVSGILIGIIGSKLILLVTQNVMGLTTGLRFYLSVKAVFLTFSVYCLIFLLISSLSKMKIQQENIIGLLKEDEKPRPAPKAHWSFALLGAILLLFGYGNVFYFSADMGANSLLPLLAGVLLTIFGTILLFYQGSVFVLKALKNRPQALQKTRLLSLAEMIYRMRDNAMMYSLITLTASVAFVGILIMMSIGDRSFSDVQGPSFAYTFYQINTESELQQEQVAYTYDTLKQAGFDPTKLEIKTAGLYLPLEENQTQNDPFFSSNSLSVISETSYRELLALMNQKPKEINGDEVLILSPSYKMRQAVLAADPSELTQTYMAEIDGKLEPVQLKYSPTIISLSVWGLAVVSDEQFETFWNLEEAEEKNYRLVVIDYPQWDQDPALDKKINKHLHQTQQLIREKNDEIMAALGDQTAEMNAEELKEANPYLWEDFHYTSKYAIFQETRQGNGVILMITVLLGTVFFSFAASILYFRLFADMKKEGAYHRSLFVLGVSDKERHNIVAQQMRVMYFLPAIVALLHFAVACVALRLLVELPVWLFYAKIAIVYLIFQTLFYLVCQARYQRHLDRIADPTQHR